MIESHAWESLVFKWDVENFTAKALAGRHIDSSTFPIAGREMRLQLNFTGAGDDQFMGIAIMQSGGFHLMPVVGSAKSCMLPDDACITDLGRGVGYNEFERVTTIRDPARGYIHADKIKIHTLIRVEKLLQCGSRS